MNWGRNFAPGPAYVRAGGVLFGDLCSPPLAAWAQAAQFDRSMSELYGSVAGLKSTQVEALRRLLRRKVRPNQVISPELATSLCGVSAEARRQVGVLLDRKGRVDQGMIGDGEKIDQSGRAHG